MGGGVSLKSSTIFKNDIKLEVKNPDAGFSSATNYKLTTTIPNLRPKKVTNLKLIWGLVFSSKKLADWTTQYEGLQFTNKLRVKVGVAYIH